MRVMGPFGIGEVLARGGSSVVHLARWHDDPTVDVVAKVATAGEELRLHHENSTLRDIQHPNVVAPVGFIDDGSSAALVLPRAACSLRAHAGRLTVEEVAHVALAVAEALAATHRAGFAHWDVSAGNILLRSDGSAVLADYGVARRGTEDGMLADLTGLASAALDALAPGLNGALVDLLREVGSSPIGAGELAARIHEAVPDPQAPDPMAATPVVDEPPTMTAS